MVQQLNLKVVTGKTIPQLQGITGKKLGILGQTTTSIIVGDNQPLEVPLAIVPDNYLEPALLLGMNALGRITLTLDHRNKRITWNNVTYPLKYHEHRYGKVTHIKIQSIATHKSSPAKAFVRLRAKLKLPPFSAAMREIKVDEAPGTTLVVDPEHKNVQGGLPLITEVTEEKTIFLPMINNSKLYLTLHQGVFLARYEIINSNLEEFPEAKCLKTTISESMGPENDAVPGKMSRGDKLNTILSERDWTHLDEEQKQKLFQIIRRHELLFMVDKNELGLITAPPAHINVENPVPCRAPIYRYPEKAKELIGEIIEDLAQRDIIEPSTAAWLSPIVLVSKPSGEKRMCLDYRKVSTHLAVDIHPLPKLEELV